MRPLSVSDTVQMVWGGCPDHPWHQGSLSAPDSFLAGNCTTKECCTTKTCNHKTAGCNYCDVGCACGCGQKQLPSYHVNEMILNVEVMQKRQADPFTAIPTALPPPFYCGCSRQWCALFHWPNHL